MKTGKTTPLAVLAALLLGGQATAHELAGPVTVATGTAPIHALAADGEDVAWRECRSVTLLDLRSRRRQKLFTVRGSGGVCTTVGSGGRVVDLEPLALSRGTLLWGTYSGHNSEYVGIWAKRPGSSARFLRELVIDPDAQGPYVTGFAGDGGEVMLGWANVAQRDPECTSAIDGTPCQFALRGGGIFGTGSTTSRLRHVPPPLLLAASRDLVGIVPARAGHTYVPLRPSNRVQVWERRTGRRLADVTVDGTPQAVAVAGGRIATIVASGIKRWLEMRDARTGRVESRIRLSGDVAGALAGGASVVAYHVDRELFVFDVRTKRARKVAMAAARPIDLVVANGNLLWAENRMVDGHLRGVVRAVRLAR